MIKKIKSFKFTEIEQNIYFADKEKINDLQKDIESFNDTYPHFSCYIFEEYITSTNPKYEIYGDYENNILSKIYIPISTFLISNDVIKNNKKILNENNFKEFLLKTTKKKYEHSNNIIQINSNKIFIGNPIIEENNPNQNNEFTILDFPNGNYNMYLRTDKTFEENYKKLNNLHNERDNSRGKKKWNNDLGDVSEENTLGMKVYQKYIDEFIFQSPNIAFISIE